MPIYEFECPEHGKFEKITSIEDASSACCPECHAECGKIFSSIALIRVHHTERLDYNDSLRVHDRRRMMKDTAVQKALSEYKDKQLSEHQGR